MPYNVIFFFVYLISMSLIALYFLHSTSVLSFYKIVVLILSTGMIPIQSRGNANNCFEQQNLNRIFLLIACLCRFFLDKPENRQICF